MTEEKRYVLSIDHLEEKLLKEIEALPQGEAVLIPSGWITNNVGHAIAVVCKVIAPEECKSMSSTPAKVVSTTAAYQILPDCMSTRFDDMRCPWRILRTTISFVEW